MVCACREWDSEVVSQAIDMHDRLLRAMMSKFNGYEVMTEVWASTGGLCEGSDWMLWRPAGWHWLHVSIVLCP